MYYIAKQTPPCTDVAHEAAMITDVSDKVKYFNKQILLYIMKCNVFTPRVD